MAGNYRARGQPISAHDDAGRRSQARAVSRGRGAAWRPYAEGRTHDDGRYTVREQIGGGGMADVHRGTDGQLGLEVALKLLKPDELRAHGPGGAGGRAGAPHESRAGVWHGGARQHRIHHGAARGPEPRGWSSLFWLASRRTFVTAETWPSPWPSRAAFRPGCASTKIMEMIGIVEIETLVTRGCVSGPEHDGSDRAPSGPSCGAAAREGLPTVDPFDQICRT